MIGVENSKSGLVEGNVPAWVVSNVKWSTWVSLEIASKAVGWKQKQNKWSGAMSWRTKVEISQKQMAQ